MTSTVATVEVLTAEVRTLMVGSRQVTMSVFKQLDRIHERRINAMGRVRFNDPKARDDNGQTILWDEQLWVVGASIRSGALVRAMVTRPERPHPNWSFVDGDTFETCLHQYETRDLPRYQYLRELPLIVLAGLR